MEGHPGDGMVIIVISTGLLGRRAKEPSISRCLGLVVGGDGGDRRVSRCTHPFPR